MTDHLPGAGEMVYEARVLMANIRYQVFRPEVTSMGACPRCGEGSRGSRVCALCLGRELDAILPPGEVWPEGALGRRYLHARNIPAARQSLQDILGNDIVVRRNKNGDLVAEIAASSTASASQINVVAGAGYGLYLLEPVRILIR